MKTFQEFVNEGRAATFNNVFGKGKQEKTGVWYADVVFKSFVTEDMAKEIANEAGITIPHDNYYKDGSNFVMEWYNAEKIKPSQIKDIKFHSFVISARRWKG